jgi:hypothetical protein
VIEITKGMGRCKEISIRRSVRMNHEISSLILLLPYSGTEEQGCPMLISLPVSESPTKHERVSR